MKPEDRGQEGVASMRALHEEASAQVDAAPDPSVRAAVLAAAARAVDAKPHDAVAGPAAVPFGRRRWPVSMAALLVVSLMTGLVVRAMRDEPDRITSVAAPREPAAVAVAPAPAAARTDEAVVTRAAPEPGDQAASIQSKARNATPVPAVPRLERPRADVAHRNDGFVPDATPESKIAAAPLRESAPVRSAPEPALPPPSVDAHGASSASPPSAGPALAARSSPASNTAQRLRRGPEPLTPEAWVERIVKLREAGDGAAADREVEALHLRHPDFAIPAAALGPAGTR